MERPNSFLRIVTGKYFDCLFMITVTAETVFFFFCNIH